MTANTITIDRLRALAEQLESDAALVREIIREAEQGEISPDQAAKQLKNAGIAIA